MERNIYSLKLFSFLNQLDNFIGGIRGDNSTIC